VNFATPVMGDINISATRSNSTLAANVELDVVDAFGNQVSCASSVPARTTPPPSNPPTTPKPPKPEPPKPHPPKPNVDNLVDSILKNQQSRTKIQTPEQQPKPVEQVTRQASMAPNLAAVVSASEIEGVRNKIRPCWNSFGGSKDAPIVTLVVQMNQDGTPVKAEVEDTGRYRSDSVFRAAADAAWRAVMNPRCQPWPLSPEKYNAWRTITFHFDPRDY
jgi:outer membrane biosynthesis protein TonB